MNRANHLARAEHCKAASERLEDGFKDWAAVALFYSALHYVHSCLADEPGLVKDERHPRKHSRPAGQDLRGTNQLVRDIYPEINVQYRSLEELSHRTRYDLGVLGPMAWPMAQRQWTEVKYFCEGKNQGRHPLPARDV